MIISNSTGVNRPSAACAGGGGRSPLDPGRVGDPEVVAGRPAPAIEDALLDGRGGDLDCAELLELNERFGGLSLGGCDLGGTVARLADHTE